MATKITYTFEDRVEQVSELARLREVEFLGFDINSDTTKVTGTTKLILRCLEHDIVYKSVSINNFVQQHTKGCRICLKRRMREVHSKYSKTTVGRNKTKDYYEDEIRKFFTKGEEFIGWEEGFGSRSVVIWKCCICGEECRTAYNDLKFGHRHAKCVKRGFDPESATILFAIAWENNGHRFINYGLTKKGNLAKRILQYKRKTVYKETLLAEKTFENSADARDAEHLIKNSFNIGSVSGKTFGDGYMKTLEYNEYNVEMITKIITEAC